MSSIIRQPTHIMSLADGSAIVGIQVKGLKAGIYTCDLLGEKGDILVKGKHYPEGSQPFAALNPEELASLKGTPKPESKKAEEEE